MTIRCPHCSGQLEIVAVGAPQPTSLDQELARITSDINYAVSLDVDKRAHDAPYLWSRLKDLANRGVDMETLAPLKDRVLLELLGLTEEQLPRAKGEGHVVPE